MKVLGTEVRLSEGQIKKIISKIQEYPEVIEALYEEFSVWQNQQADAGCYDDDYNNMSYAERYEHDMMNERHEWEAMQEDEYLVMVKHDAKVWSNHKCARCSIHPELHSSPASCGDYLD